jgi:prevent-host-death family protein
MRRVLSTLELRQKLGEVLDRVRLRQDEFIIARKGKPLAAVVPVQRIEQLQRAARLHLLDVLEQLPADELSQREADALADEAKHRTRSRRARSRGR